MSLPIKTKHTLLDVVRLVDMFTVLHMIGCSKMNEILPDVSPNKMSLDFYESWNKHLILFRLMTNWTSLFRLMTNWRSLFRLMTNWTSLYRLMTHWTSLFRLMTNWTSLFHMSLNFIFSAKTNVIKKEIIKKKQKNTEQNCIWIILSKVDQILLITPCRLQRKK